MFPTLQGSGCGQGEDSGFTKPASEDEREHDSRARCILSVPLSAPRIVSVFYLKAVPCKNTQSWDWEDAVARFHHLLLTCTIRTMPHKKCVKCTHFFMNRNSRDSTDKNE